MRPTFPRAAAAPLLIAAAVIVGGHMIFVGPAKARLAQARARAAEHDASGRNLQAIRSALPALTAAEAEARSHAAAIELANTPASDPGALFATLADLAAEHRVRVDQLDPFTPRRPAPLSAGNAAGVMPPEAPAGAVVPPPDTQLGYTMTVVASYADLAGFLSALQTRLGFTRILSVRIAASSEGPETVSARIQTVHHAFAIPSLRIGVATQEAPR